MNSDEKQNSPTTREDSAEERREKEHEWRQRLQRQFAELWLRLNAPKKEEVNWRRFAAVAERPLDSRAGPSWLSRIDFKTPILVRYTTPFGCHVVCFTDYIPSHVLIAPS